MKKSKGQRRGPFRQRIVSDESQIPQGWVRMGDIVREFDGVSNGPTSAALSAATLRGDVDSVRIRRFEDQKRGGGVYVEPKQARDFARNRLARRKKKAAGSEIVQDPPENGERRPQEQDTMFVSSSRVKALERRVETLTSTNKTMNEALNRTLKRLHVAEKKIRDLEEHRGFEVKGIRVDNPTETASAH